MSKGFWSRLNCRLFGPPVTVDLVPPKRAMRAGSPAQQPEMRGRPHALQELALLFPWFTDGDLERLLSAYLSILAKYPAWTRKDIPADPWQQMFLWAIPLALPRAETISLKEVCALLRLEIINGLRTYSTPGDVLRQPVRVLWLQQQGLRIEAIYRLLEQHPGSHQHPAPFVWWTIFGL